MKELLKSDSICQSYAQMKKGPVIWLSVWVSLHSKGLMSWFNIWTQTSAIAELFGLIYSIYSRVRSGRWEYDWLTFVQVLVYISLLRRSLRGTRCLPLDAVPRCRVRLRQRAACVVPLPLCPRVVRPAVSERRSVRRPTLSSRRHVPYRRPTCFVVTRSNTPQPCYQVGYLSYDGLYLMLSTPVMIRWGLTAN